MYMYLGDNSYNSTILLKLQASDKIVLVEAIVDDVDDCMNANVHHLQIIFYNKTKFECVLQFYTSVLKLDSSFTRKLIRP